MRKDLYTNGSVDLPKISKGRSFFDLSHSYHCDMNIGILYPIDKAIIVVPGDTFDLSHKLNIRMTNPPKTPTMDQLVLDIYYFYVPNRIIWNDWNSFITNFNSSNYNGNFSGSIPTIAITSWSTSTYAGLSHSVLDYLGFGAFILQGAGSSYTAYNPIALPVRAYYEIWNEYFRYAPLQNPILVSKGSNVTYACHTTSYPYYDGTSVTGYASQYSTFASSECYGLGLLPVNRLPGYFSRCLPQPVNTGEVKILEDINLLSPMLYRGSGGTTQASNGALSVFSGYFEDSGSERITSIKGSLGSSTSNSIRALSNAFALNKFLYTDNVYGKRITDWTYGHFGVNIPDSTAQIPEFLSKKRVYLNVNQVIQTSSTDTTSAQGNAGAWSQTYEGSHDFVKSFTEFGWLLSLGCIRVLNHSTGQGIDKYWTYRTRYDFPLPEFVNTGDQPVYQVELALVNAGNGVFGYQERYAEAKMIPSGVAGFMRPQVSNTLSLWTYVDYYSAQPTFSASWMFEPHANFNNTVYVSDSTAPGFILDYVADLKAYRTLPYHSIPGGLTGSW